MTDAEITALAGLRDWLTDHAEKLEDEGFANGAAGRRAWSDAVGAILAEREVMRGALEFYANPETYHACGFLFDPPTGGFDEDFSDDHGHEDYPRATPGKTARQALSALEPKEPEHG